MLGHLAKQIESREHLQLRASCHRRLIRTGHDTGTTYMLCNLAGNSKVVGKGARIDVSSAH
jgi:hypothetical protein